MEPRRTVHAVCVASFRACRCRRSVFDTPAPGEQRGPAIHLERARVRSGRQTITVTVSERPAHAGIDPYHTLIGRHKEIMLFETTVEVEIEGS